MNPRVNGKFISNKCPDRNCEGTLQHVSDTVWECDGLIDPESTTQELQPCCVSVVDGKLFV